MGALRPGAAHNVFVAVAGQPPFYLLAPISSLLENTRLQFGRKLLVSAASVIVVRVALQTALKGQQIGGLEKGRSWHVWLAVG